MNLNHRLLPLLLMTASATGISAAQTHPSAKLDIGDPAPALKSSKWLKGTPIPKFEKGHVYVLEFWATWCTACRNAMPHLSELARKYKGSVEMIGVDAYEQEALPKVTQFLKSNPSLMNYRVVADAAGDTTAIDWIQAAGLASIPSTFVVGKDGRIAWIGRPADLDAILPKVVAGTLDLAEERAHRNANLDPSDAISIALSTHNYTEAIELIRMSDQRKLGDFRPQLYEALAHVDEAQLRKQVRADVDRTGGDFGIYNALSIVLTHPGAKPEAYRFGLTMIDESLAKGGPKVLLLVRGAVIAMNGGDKKKAVELQSQALEVAKTESTPERQEEIRADLLKYKAQAGE